MKVLHIKAASAALTALFGNRPGFQKEATTSPKNLVSGCYASAYLSNGTSRATHQSCVDGGIDAGVEKDGSHNCETGNRAAFPENLRRLVKISPYTSYGALVEHTQSCVDGGVRLGAEKAGRHDRPVLPPDPIHTSSLEPPVSNQKISDFLSKNASRSADTKAASRGVPQSWDEAEKSGNWAVSLDSPSIPLLVAHSLTGKPLPSTADLAKQAAQVAFGGDRKIDQLLTAKTESDRRNYKAKHNIMRKLLAAHPSEFLIDSSQNGLVGLTHVPTGFRMHLPKTVLPTSSL